MRFLERASGVEQIRQLKRRSYELMRVRPGQRVLDVGCGLGDDVRALAALVGPTGRAVGVDLSEAMVVEARQRSAGAGLAVAFAVGDAHRLDFPDSSLDACRTERTLHVAAEPARAVAELVRVTRPGGHIVALEMDHEMSFLHPGDKATTRTFTLSFVDSVPQGWIGRQLTALFLDAGLVEVATEPQVVVSPELELVRRMILDAHLAKVKQSGLLPADRVDAWLADLVEAHRHGTFLFGLTIFGVVGRKPPAAADG
jgi:ubiquinone/menaquinone biosynthesis C-methylase UbiE